VRPRNWLIGVALGVALGLVAGALQWAFFHEDTHIARADLEELVVFNDFWAIAPPVLKRAELVRSTLTVESREANEPAVNSDSVTLELLNGWMRYVDDVVFRFVVDEGLKSADIAGSAKRYARLRSGNHAGLGQRALELNVTARSTAEASEELKRWSQQILSESQARMRHSMNAWFARKADALQTFTRDNLPPSKNGFDIVDDDMVAQFRAAAKSSSTFAGQLAISTDITVEPVGEPATPRLLMWAVIGGVLSIIGMVAYGAKSRR